MTNSMEAKIKVLYVMLRVNHHLFWYRHVKEAWIINAKKVYYKELEICHDAIVAVSLRHLLIDINQ